MESFIRYLSLNCPIHIASKSSYYMVHLKIALVVQSSFRPACQSIKLFKYSHCMTYIYKALSNMWNLWSLFANQQITTIMVQFDSPRRLHNLCRVTFTNPSLVICCLLFLSFFTSPIMLVQSPKSSVSPVGKWIWHITLSKDSPFLNIVNQSATGISHRSYPYWWCVK